MTGDSGRAFRLAVYRGVARSLTTALWISSQEISDETGINATQVRRDLSAIDAEGRRGTGYWRSGLIVDITSALSGFEVAVAAEADQRRRLVELAEHGRP